MKAPLNQLGVATFRRAVSTDSPGAVDADLAGAAIEGHDVVPLIPVQSRARYPLEEIWNLVPEATVERRVLFLAEEQQLRPAGRRSPRWQFDHLQSCRRSRL